MRLDPANQGGIAALKKLGVDTEGLVKEVVVDDAILQSYVGKYELAANFILTVTKESSQLSAQATGQGAFPVFPKSDSTFYYKVVAAEGLVKEVVVDDAILQSYVGKYELAPNFILTVTKESSQLSAQATGQGAFPIFPKSDSVFYYKVVAAELVFNFDAKGAVQSVTLHQGGQVIPGKKMEE